MALNTPAWLLANAFTKETADEFGAVKGAPCTVGDVTFDADGNTVVELVWTNSAGASRTTPVTIRKGLGIKSVAIDASEHLILTLTDNTTVDAGEIPKPDLSGYAKKTEIPTKVEDLDDAADYAKKSEIPEGSVVDENLSETSKNPVQNKIITAELKKYVPIQQKVEDKGKALIVGEDGKLLLGTVATDGLEIVDKTQAEYDALTDEEKNDPTKLYNITDAEDVDISKYATLNYVNASLGEKADKTDLTEVNEKIDNIYDDGYASTNLLPYPYVGENALSGTKVEGGLTYTDNGDGSITIDGTSTGTSYIRLNVNGGIFGNISGSMISDIGQLEIGEYTAIVSETKDNRLIVAYDPSRDLLAITANGSGQAFNNEKFYPRVVKNNVADKSYNAYSKSNVDLTTEISRNELELAELKMLGWNVPKDFPIHNEVNGNQFIQRVGRVSLYDKTWEADGIGVGGVNVFRFEIPTNCKTYSNSTKWNIYVDGYKTLPLVLGYSGNDVASHDMAVGGRNAGGNFIEFSTTKYSTATDFKAYMNASGLYLYYELATPITKSIIGNENPNIVGSKLERFVAPATDAELLALPNGIYSINVADVGTSLFPTSWGTLVVLKSGFVYGTMLYIGANAKVYFRNINNGAWRESSWTALN